MELLLHASLQWRSSLLQLKCTSKEKVSAFTSHFAKVAALLERDPLLLLQPATETECAGQRGTQSGSTGFAGEVTFNIKCKDLE